MSTPEFSAPALNKIDVVILAGGLGTRIRGVLGDVPKILAPIGELRFLDYLLEWLAAAGADRVILCLGHLAGAVTDYLQKQSRNSMTVIPVIEQKPAGTAGAIRLARPRLHSDPVFVINGDTFIDTDLSDFVATHRSNAATISMLCTQVPSTARYGSLELDSTGHVARFIEKDAGRDRPGLISGGMYLFSPAALDDLMKRPGPSLERDYLQSLPAGTIKAHPTQSTFIDIGTPESLAAAADIIPRAVTLARTRRK